MKNKAKSKLNKKDVLIDVLIGVIVLLLIIIIVICIKNSFADKGLSNKTENTFICTQTNENYKETYKLYVDATGELIKYEQTTETTYPQDEYDGAKEGYQSLNEENVKFDDKAKTISQTITNNMIDEDGSHLHVWYVDYMNSLTSQNFTCES